VPDTPLCMSWECYDHRKSHSAFINHHPKLCVQLMSLWRRRRCDLAADVVEKVRASFRGEVVLGWFCIEKAMSVSHSEALAFALALAQGGAELRRSGFGVDGVGWLAGVAVVAGVVIASSSARLSGHDRTSGEEECCDSE